MAKAMRMMEENVSLCDAVVFVLDARAPASTFNPKLLPIAGSRPILYLLNKSDLADRGAAEIAAAMRASGRRALLFSAGARGGARLLREEMASLARERTERLAARGVGRPARFLVAGIPNTGKSTVINLLAGAGKAQTGDRAGVTRAKQWVKCGAFDLLDTPGTMPPSCEDQRLAARLAFVGSINDDVLDLEEISLALLAELYARYPEGLRARYGAAEEDPAAMLEAVCKRRCFLRGGEPDLERGVRAVIDDFRKGRLGRVCLDTADDARGAGLS